MTSQKSMGMPGPPPENGQKGFDAAETGESLGTVESGDNLLLADHQLRSHHVQPFDVEHSAPPQSSSAPHGPQSPASNGHASAEPPTEPTATWREASYHIVTAVVGAGILGLPNAFARLTWVGGLIVLALSACVSCYTAYLLAALHQSPTGERRNSYVALGREILGPRGGFAVAPFQTIVMVGLGITYVVVAGQSLQAVFAPGCNSAVMAATAQGAGSGGVGDADRTGCAAGLAWATVGFGASQMALSQLRDFHSLWWVSLIGAAMSAAYSAIAFGTSLAWLARNPRPSYSLDWRLSSAEQALSIGNAVGTIMFAFGGHAVLVEIQATLAPTPSPFRGMLRGLISGYIVVMAAYWPVACAGYAAFGQGVNANVLLSVQQPVWSRLANLAVVVHLAAGFQVFSQPVFGAVEGFLGRQKPGLLEARRGTVVRLLTRCCYVVVATAIAISLPFFTELMGFIGAVGFTPTTFLLPPILWLKARETRVWEKALNWSIIVAFSLGGSYAGVSSVFEIVEAARRYHNS